MENFETPEIKNVTLEMAILKSKQLDKNTESDVFSDPYDLFLNTLEPPKISDIHQAIQTLLKEDALRD